MSKVAIGIDTADLPLGLAVSVDQDPPVWAEYTANRGLKHAETLMPALERLLGDLQLTAADIDLVVCASGPGSFTGLRIGYATAKGIAAGSGASIVSVSTLDALAWPFSHYPGLVVPVLDARKRRVYAALFAGPERATQDQDLTPAELVAQIQEHRQRLGGGASALPVLLTGSGYGFVQSLLQDASVESVYASAVGLTARSLLELGMPKYRRGAVDDPDAGPTYLRQSDAELSRGR